MDTKISRNVDSNEKKRSGGECLNTGGLSNNEERMIFDAVPDAVFVHDYHTGALLDVNSSMLEMFGYSRSEAMTLGPDDSSAGVSPYGAKEALQWLSRAKSSGTQRFEWISKRKNGELFPTEIILSPGKIGKEQLLIAVVRDISQQKAAEAALKESEERYRRLANATHEAVAISCNGKIVDVSKQIESIYGYSAADFPHMSMSKVVHPDDLDLVLTNMRNNEKGPYRHRGIRKDGETIYLEVRSEIISIHDIEHRLTIIRDVTDERKMQEKLLQSEKMRVIGQLAGGVAHDFNNQLAGIVGIAELLRLDVEPDERLVKYTNYILSASQRAADLIGQLLAFAKKGVYQPARVDLHRIVDEVVNILSHTLAKSITIRKQLNASHSCVVGDASQLQNVLTNLAINARDAMPNGGELIFSSDDAEIDEAHDLKDQKLAAGRYLKLCVVDTGEGMSEEVSAKMFEPFFTTKPADKGTGMGLASVYGIVTSHQGGIFVRSRLGEGTRIKLLLPSCNEDEAPKRDSRTEIETGEGKARILLVDDEPIVLTSAELSLQQLGYEVVARTNGKEALAYYCDHWKEIDLVLLDMLMPQMDGKTAYAKMKAINPNIVVLLSSGYALNSDAREILDAGASDFLQKPYSIGKLSKKIAALLGDNR